jgi:hypothetical protein
MRRVKRPVAWMAAALAVYALAGFFAVPPLIRHQLPSALRNFLAREASLREASFNPLTLRVTLRGFDLRDRDGGPLAAFDALTANFQASSLFRRAWTFREIRLTKPVVTGRIGGDGRLTAADLFEPKSSPEPSKPFRLPRVLVGDLIVEAGVCTFEDASREPPFATTLQPLDVHVSGLTTIPDRTGDHAITIGVEDRGEIRWAGRLEAEPLRLEGKLDLTLRRLDRLWTYFGNAYPLDVSSGEAHLSLPYIIEKRAGGGLSLDAHDVDFSVSGLAGRARGDTADWVRAGRVSLYGGRVRWPEQTAVFERAEIDQPAAWVRRKEDGKVDWLELFDRFKAMPSTERKGKAAHAAGWKAVVKAIDVKAGTLEIEDRAVSPPATLTTSEFESHVEDLTSDASMPLRTRASAKIGGAPMTSSGTIELKPAVVTQEFKLRGFDVKASQPYLNSWLRARLESGTASTEGKLVYRQGGSPIFQFDGRTSLDGLAIADPGGRRVASWDALAVDGIHLTLAPNRLDVRAIDLRKPFTEILIDHDRNFVLRSLLVERPSTPSTERTSPAAAARAGFPLSVAAIRLHDASIGYVDESLARPFRTTLHSVQGSLTAVSLQKAAPSRLLFEGTVDADGYVKAEGSTRLGDPWAGSDVVLLLRNVDMKSLTPYTAEFAGSTIADGRLDLAASYKVHDRALDGTNKVTATNLTLGEKVDGAKSPLPLRLAVALLKDPHGRIELDVPVEGSADDPEFGYRTVAWQAFKRVMTNVTTAPFRFLGRMMGIQGDDLELVSFEPARSDLLPPEKEKLVKLTQALQERPGLNLHVVGRFDPATDSEALRKGKLEAALASQSLEALYTATFSAEQLAAARAKHISGTELDSAGYDEELRSSLLAKQAVGDDELTALGQARSDAIIAALDASRVTAAPVEPVKKKKEGETLVPCELTIPAD